MGGCGFYIFIIVVGAIALIIVSINQTPEQRDQSLYGFINLAMMCPHCQTKGKVRTKSVAQKKGVSGGKATAALLTGGVSLLATGLSRKENSTQAHCTNCNNTWFF